MEQYRGILGRKQSLLQRGASSWDSHTPDVSLLIVHPLCVYIHMCDLYERAVTHTQVGAAAAGLAVGQSTSGVWEGSFLSEMSSLDQQERQLVGHCLSSGRLF